jgi:acetyl-CoA carboxylase beta subunit
VRFSELTPAQRVGALLDAGSFEPGDPSGSLVLGRGRIDGRQVSVVATDPRTARGAIGVAESRGLSQLLARARDERAPVVLLLDSSGARVDEGLPALGAFRVLLRETLLTRLAGLPMLAVVGRACFGGASLLACTCSRRHYLIGARLAASGPAVIEGAVGAAQFDAHNQPSVDALMGSAARVGIDAGGALIEDTPDSVSSGARGWLRDVQVQPQTWSPEAEHHLQGARLFATGVAAAGRPRATEAVSARLAAILPRGCQPRVEADAFCAFPPAGSRGAAFLGTLSGAPVGAATCWQLADWLLALHRDHPDSPIVLVLDADGHAATVTDEQLLLSAYLVHLSLTLAWLRSAGHRIVLWIAGRASGASYVTFAAPVDVVSALPSAQIEILPAAAVKQIVKATQNTPAGPAALLEAGVADGLLDDRLGRYADPTVQRP